MEYKEGYVMWNLMDFGFYSEEGGKTLEDLRRGVIKSNILNNNSDCHVEIRMLVPTSGWR